VALLLSACGGSIEETIAKAQDTRLTPHQRCVAMDDLSFEGGPAVAPLRRLAHDTDVQVAKCARKAIAAIYDSHAARALLPVLEDDDPRVVASAAEALGNVGDARAVDPLVGLLGRDNPRVVASAASALGQLGDASTAPRLVPLLTSPNGKVVGAAESALNQVADSSVLPALEKLALRRGATPAEDKAGRQGRRAAADVMGSIGDRGARATLVRVLATDPACARIAGAALAQIFRDDVTPLLPLLEKKSNIALAYGLVDTGQDGTQAALVTALHRYGDYDLAVYYLNCGDDKLESAAEKWADNHGYSVFTTPGIGGDEEWGSAR
jgi:HEAT repeat protein